MKILVGHEESQAVTIRLRNEGKEAYSCDLKPCSGGHPEWHFNFDVFKAIEGGELQTQSGDIVTIDYWYMGIFFPDCTYLTCSAEWAYKDPDYTRYPEIGYHQKVKEGTLTGLERRMARLEAVLHVKKLYNSYIPKVSIENPVGKLSKWFMPPSQIIQPYDFGDDASKKTCLWLKNLPNLKPTKYVEPRYVNDKPRWGNQTDSGQNKLPPSKNRSELRSKTFPGIAKAMAEQWI